MPSNVRFIRKGGHIIPIKINRQQSDTRPREGAKAAALVAAGTGVGVAAGTVAANLHRESATHNNIAKKLVGYALKESKDGRPLAAARTRKFAANSILEMRRFHMAGNAVKHSGAAASAALIGAGVNKALNQTSLKDHPKTKAAVATGAAVGAHFAIRSSYLKSIGRITTFSAIKEAARRLAARGLKL